MTRKELEKKLGKKKLEEVEAYVKQLKGRSPDEIVAAVKSRFPDCIPADILVLVPL